MSGIKFGAVATQAGVSWESLLSVWQDMDVNSNFESMWLMDHFVTSFGTAAGAEGPCMESWTALAALAIFQFLWVWNDLLLALILMGDPSVRPMTVQVQTLVSSFGTNYQVLTAAAFISMILPLAVFFALQRYFVQGILAGSVKG